MIQSSLKLSDLWSLLPNWQIVPNAISRNLVEFQFPGTAYSIPQLAIEAARVNDPEIAFTRARSENVQRLVEELIGDKLFLPNDREVLWGRRLNGPIQFITYLLTGVALILILFAWINSVSQNWAVTMVRKVPLNGFRSPDLASAVSETIDRPVSEAALVDESAEVEIVGQNEEETAGQNEEETAGQNEEENAGQNEEETLPLEQLDDLPTPWNDQFFIDCPLDLSDAHRTADYYERVSRQIQNDSEFLGVYVDPPVLRFRRAAVRAVANTEDTSILPPFLDAQKNSILAYYDARLSIVRFLLWVIPTVGFIGTIIGVSGALSSTIGLQSTRDLVSGFAQSSVSASMGMAFDTTLVALIAAVAVMLAYHIVQGSEERMTVLERNRAEEEVLTVSRSVRKPGGTADLAQQLILLGVNTEALVRDLKLFQRSGPELAALIRALNERRSELEQIDLEALFGQKRGRNRAFLMTSLLLVALFILVAYEGYLGEKPRQLLGNAANWMSNLF